MTIKKFFGLLLRCLLMWRMEREIYNSVFPHLKGNKTCDYPFSNENELAKAGIHGELDATLCLKKIERCADQMPEAYGHAFRYLAYRDLTSLLQRYVAIAEKRVYNPAPSLQQNSAEAI